MLNPKVEIRKFSPKFEIRKFPSKFEIRKFESQINCQLLIGYSGGPVLLSWSFIKFGQEIETIGIRKFESQINHQS
jgi:hypothetical protein